MFLVDRKLKGDTSKVINYDFKRTFPLSGRSPSKMTIARNKDKFLKEGSVLNLNKGRSGRRPSALTGWKLQMLEDLVDQEKDLPARVSRSSCRRHRLPVPMSKSSFNRGIKKLGFHPYKMVHRNALKESDFPRRLEMCRFIVEKNEAEPNWLKNLWTSDEANFNLNGVVNSKNVVCYAPSKMGRPSNFCIDTVKHPDGVMVFGCLRLDGKKIPLKFFYPKWVNGERVSGTLDGDGYYKLMRYHCLPEIRAVNNGTLDEQGWHQDGASMYIHCKVYFSFSHFKFAGPHRTLRNLNLVQGSFSTNVLALGSERWGGKEW